MQYKLQNTEEWITATVVGRPGKATGKNKHWYTIQEEISKEKKSVNLDQVQWELIIDEANINLVQKQNSGIKDTTAAKLAEVQKLHYFNTNEEVNDCDQNTLSTRWVIANKDEQTKARLVVRGFEEEFTMPSDSPTVDKGIMRIFLTISSINNWTVKTTDIKAAFLQGREIRRGTYTLNLQERAIQKRETKTWIL